MRIITLAILLLFLQAPSLLAQSSYDFASARQLPANKNLLQVYQQPLSFSATDFQQSINTEQKKHPLVKTGKILTFIGLPLLVIGGVMVANADALYYTCVNGECEGDARGGFGVVILGAGAGLTGTGIVLWSIGSSKSRD